MTRTLIIGTRASKLALRQVELVREALRAAEPRVSLEVREIKTEGDRTSAPLSAIGGLGVFTKAIEDALLAHEIDIAVHSLKDLPTETASGLVIAAVPEREDVRDGLVTRDGRRLGNLPAGARIGTGAGRRAVQLRHLRSDIGTAEIRGNVDTRIRKVEEGAYDGAVLAMAGLRRLALAAKAAQVFDIDEMLPAVGQGALAIETRADDAEARAAVRVIEDGDARAAVEAERAYLRRLGGGCRLPVAAYGSIEGETLRLRGMIAGDDARVFRGEVRGVASDPEALGVRLADELLAQGAARFVEAQ
ncbi:MAG TPA: hydroxymethylbilane synthase [Dehalococcoidia bacterium]|nr:hydroxymethylbilane synthase [Dehalococcoidia bacterium]